MSTYVTAPVTDDEYWTHVWPTAEENWWTEYGRVPQNEADYADVTAWADVLRQSYDTGEFDITWR